MSKLGQNLSQYWFKIQGSLFPGLEEELDPLTKKQQQLITILEVIRIEEFIPDCRGKEGRPQKDRSAIARSFVAKMVYNITTTRFLWDRLHSDKNLRRICGWENKRQIPSESTFSRAMTDFANTELPQRVHESLIKKNYEETETIIIHNSIDATAIEAREKTVKPAIPIKEAKSKPKNKGGRPRKGEKKTPKEPTPKEPISRIEKQQTMSLQEMLEDLPKECNIGTKKNSKGHVEHWNGYKLHLGVADGGIPISAILTSASVHDSQVAIPLLKMTAQRVVNLYDVMDAGYDILGIIANSKSLGHVPLIDKNPRWDTKLRDDLAAEAKGQKTLNFKPAEKIRYEQRTTVERVNARLKDEFGARMVRVRTPIKVMCHLMFGLLALTADQLMKLVI